MEVVPVTTVIRLVSYGFLLTSSVVNLSLITSVVSHVIHSSFISFTAFPRYHYIKSISSKDNNNKKTAAFSVTFHALQLQS